MTSFAFLFMIFSMACVTTLTTYCLYRILTSGPPASDNGED